MRGSSKPRERGQSEKCRNCEYSHPSFSRKCEMIWEIQNGYSNEEYQIYHKGRGPSLDDQRTNVVVITKNAAIIEKSYYYRRSDLEGTY